MWRKGPAVALIALCFFVIACEDDDQTQPAANPQISGSLVRVEGCKSTVTGDVTGSGSACMRFSYDPASKKLSLTHVNAGFNCCPEKISAAVSVDGSSIRIVESEIGPNCRCNCLFDLYIEVENVPPAAFTVTVDEPLLNEQDVKMEFPIDLTKQTSGEHCVPRNFYPWGL